jgi:hypothetical protein
MIHDACISLLFDHLAAGLINVLVFVASNSTLRITPVLPSLIHSVLGVIQVSNFNLQVGVNLVHEKSD